MSYRLHVITFCQENFVFLDEKISDIGDDYEEDNSISIESKENEDVVPELLKQKIKRQRSRTRTISRSVYTDTQGNPVSQDVISDLNQFQVIN